LTARHDLQLERFAGQLEPLIGVRPALDDVASLIEALYALAGDRKLLAAIDEFPYLLPTQTRERDQVVTAVSG
jgi:hypothetical protein